MGFGTPWVSRRAGARSSVSSLPDQRQPRAPTRLASGQARPLGSLFPPGGAVCLRGEGLGLTPSLPQEPGKVRQPACSPV